VQLTWNQTDGQPGAGTAMVAFSGGPAAEECRSWTAEERTTRYMAALSPVYRALPPALLRTRFMDWPGDAWTKASYSFPAPGQITSFGQMLWDGLGPLHFAGEHCAYAFTGYMEGALHSGVSVARRIAAL
jgi:monoamine oxidase